MIEGILLYRLIFYQAAYYFIVLPPYRIILYHITPLFIQYEETSFIMYDGFVLLRL